MTLMIYNVNNFYSDNGTGDYNDNDDKDNVYNDRIWGLPPSNVFNME